MSPRPRIGIDARLIGSFGIGSYIRGLLAALAAVGDDEQYVVFVRPGDEGHVPATFETIAADVPVYGLRDIALMGSVVARARLDLLHAPHYVVPFASRERTGAIVVTLHDAIPFHYPLPNPLAFPYIAWTMQRAVDRAARVLTVSHAARHDLLRALDCAPEKIVPIHIGVDDQFFREEIDPSPVAAPYFLFAGKAARHKNLDILMDAFEEVRSHDPHLQLVLAGRGHERFSDRAGVITPGFVPDDQLPSLYAGAVAVVLPSLAEGFGIPPLEGMAVGTPAITSDIPAVVEVTGDAALHVDPRSAGELARAMDRMAHDRDLRAEFALRGRERARMFRWSRCAQATREVYLEVLAAR